MKRALGNDNFGIRWKEKKRLTDLDFADDVALLAENCQQLQDMTESITVCASQVGLRISQTKSKIQKVGACEDFTITVEGTPLDEVVHFPYLGSYQSSNGDTEQDLKCRLAKATSVFQRLHHIWNSKAYKTPTKLRLYASIVLPTATYASETWRNTVKMAHKLNVFHQRCLRKIFGICWKDHILMQKSSVALT